MSQAYTILRPLPELKLPSKSPKYNFSRGLSIVPLTPQVRRGILNAAEERGSDEKILGLILQTDAIFWAEIPRPWPIKDQYFISATYYTTVADAILNRIFDCLLLFADFETPLLSPIWFVAAGSVDRVDTKTVELLPGEIWDWRINDMRPQEATFALLNVKKYWGKLSNLCQIEQLIGTFTDAKKQKGYFAAGNKNAKRKVDELIKAKYGQEAVIDWDDTTTVEPVNGRKPTTTITPKMYSRFFFDGYHAAYRREIDKLGRKRYEKPSGRRFIRAFQFFLSAFGPFKVAIHHRFVTLVTCLEALFCTGVSEIAFQLASRIAWFLSPDDVHKRTEIFEKVKSLYDLRSRIVHGEKYSVNKIEESQQDIVDLARRVLLKILSDQQAYTVFFDKDQNRIKSYLQGLNLGKTCLP